GPELPDIRAKAISAEKLLAQGLGSGRWREDAEILAWFGDWELLSPGLVSLLEWRPPTAHPPERAGRYHSFFGGVARKRYPKPGLLIHGHLGLYLLIHGHLGLYLHRDVEGEFGYADGRAGMRAGVGTPQLKHQVREAIDHRGGLVEARG